MVDTSDWREYQPKGDDMDDDAPATPSSGNDTQPTGTSTDGDNTNPHDVPPTNSSDSGPSIFTTGRPATYWLDLRTPIGWTNSYTINQTGLIGQVGIDTGREIIAQSFLWRGGPPYWAETDLFTHIETNRESY